MTKLILGTANFDNNYGSVLKNKINSGKISRIISLAQKKNINHFDTAKSYLGAEQILGTLLDKSKPLIIDTKISEENCSSIDTIIASIEDSLKLLKVPKLSTIYVHNSDLILGERKGIVVKALDKILQLDLASHLGVSVYNYNDLINCKHQFPSLTRFQINENICDRRSLNQAKLFELATTGNKINVRSIFLQGLLLVKPEKLHKKFKKVYEQLYQLNKFAFEHKVSVLDLCVSYAKSIPWADGIVIGIDSDTQLDEIFNSNFVLPNNWDRSVFKISDEFIDPRLWKL